MVRTIGMGGKNDFFCYVLERWMDELSALGGIWRNPIEKNKEERMDGGANRILAVS